MKDFVDASRWKSYQHRDSQKEQSVEDKSNTWRMEIHNEIFVFKVCGIALLLVACIDFKNAKSVHAIVEGLSSKFLLCV